MGKHDWSKAKCRTCAAIRAEISRILARRKVKGDNDGRKVKLPKLLRGIKLWKCDE